MSDRIPVLDTEPIVHRRRLSQRDAHYAGDLVDAATILALFGDAATELMVRSDGVEGLLAAYERIDMKSPSHAGDFVEVRASFISAGNRSRRIALTALRYIEPDLSRGAGARLLAEPVLVCEATMVSVVPQIDRV